MARASSKNSSRKAAATRSAPARLKSAASRLAGRVESTTKLLKPRKSSKATKPTTPLSLPLSSLVSSPDSAQAYSVSIDPEKIRVRAWEIWNREGCPSGRDLDHWLLAEYELRQEPLLTADESGR